MNQKDKNKAIHDILNSSNSGIDKTAVEKAAKSGDANKLLENLSSEDKAKILNVLSDQKAMEQILKNPKAQALLKLFGGKNG